MQIKDLPDDARARAIWDLWMEFANDHTVPDGVYTEILAQELLATGDSGMRVLLDALEGLEPGVGVAKENLWRFGARTVPPLITMLQNGSEERQYAALGALWRFTLHDLAKEQVNAIREGVTPLLEHRSRSIREEARIVLEDLRTHHSD